MEIRPLRRKRSTATTKKESNYMADNKTHPQGAVEPASTGYLPEHPRHFAALISFSEEEVRALRRIVAAKSKLCRSRDANISVEIADRLLSAAGLLPLNRMKNGALQKGR